MPCSMHHANTLKIDSGTRPSSANQRTNESALMCTGNNSRHNISLSLLSSLLALKSKLFYGHTSCNSCSCSAGYSHSAQQTVWPCPLLQFGFRANMQFTTIALCVRGCSWHRLQAMCNLQKLLCLSVYGSCKAAARPQHGSESCAAPKQPQLLRYMAA